MQWTLRSVVKFCLCVLGIYGSFLSWGIMQEKLTAEGYANPDDPEGPKARFKIVAVLNTAQAGCAFLVGTVFMLLCGADRSAPLKDFFLVSVTTTTASPFGYQALNYVDYPLFALGKACKLIPVMLMSVFRNNTKYSINEYLAVALISFGVASYSVKTDASLTKSYADTAIGLGFIFINLFMDGFTNTEQDRMHKRRKELQQAAIPSSVFMCYLNMWAIVLLVSFIVGEHALLEESSFTRAAAFFAKYPQAKWDVLAFSLLGSCGQLFIFYTIREFGSLTNTTICITRKFLTIVISVIRFGHPMSATKWAGVAAVFGGLGLQTLHKYNKQRSQAAPSKKQE